MCDIETRKPNCYSCLKGVVMNDEMLIDASPTKELFLETLVKDVNITDAILDLVDNAIDGYSRNDFKERRSINLELSKSRFLIHDICGGIDLESARKEIFRFGVVKGEKHSLGVYGIGLKRSMFKLGSIIVFESDDGNKYFRVEIDVEEWKKREGWNFEFSKIEESENGSFTKVTIRKLKDEVKREFESDRFINELSRRIGKTYFMFIKDQVDISVNGIEIPPYKLEMAFSEDVEPAHKKMSFDGIDVKLFAGAHPDYKEPGWYIFCNGRMIISGERTEKTGWGFRGVPVYHPKFNRFKGFAFIESDDPRKLPWTTAKNEIDKDSAVYAKILPVMQNMMVQYTRTVNRYYPSEKDEAIGIEGLGKLTTKPLFELDKEQEFKAPPPPKRPIYTTISYSKKKDEVDALKRCMGRPGMTNKDLGERTFKYYKEMECSDEE
jgi:hypothetical protein